MARTSLTVVNDGKLRGVLAPARTVSRETLEDIIDLMEWSSPEAIRATERRIRDADRRNSWIPAKEVEKRFKARARVRK